MQKLFISYKSSFSDLPRGVWFLSVIALINRSGSMVIFFLTLYLTREMNTSVSTAGYIIGIYGIGAMIGSLAGGFLSDKIGAVRIQYYSLFLNGLCFIGLSFFNNLYYFSALLFITGIVAEAMRPANNSLLADNCPAELRARGYGLNRLAINLGVTIGPALGGFLAIISYQFLFWIDGITCIIASIVMMFNHKKYLIQNTHTIHSAVNVKSPIKNLSFILILIVLYLVGLKFMQILNTWPLYLSQFNSLTEEKIGFLLTLNAFIIVIFEMPLIKYLELKDNLKIVFIGMLLLVTGVGITPFYSSYSYIIFTVIIWTIGEMLVFPFITGYIANMADDSNRGRYMGMTTFIFSLSQITGPVLGTFIYDLFGGKFLFYSINFMLIPLSIMMFFIFRLRKKSLKIYS